MDLHKADTKHHKDNQLIWYMLCYAILCYAILCYAIPCYAMLWYDMIWYDTIRYDSILFDIWDEMRWDEMRWDMIWHDMTWHDMTWPSEALMCIRKICAICMYSYCYQTTVASQIRVSTSKRSPQSHHGNTHTLLSPVGYSTVGHLFHWGRVSPTQLSPKITEVI